MSVIVQKENPVLRAISQKVAKADIPSKHIQDVIAKMHAALKTQIDGVALAAPQIGYSIRIFVISPNILENKPLVFINPKIIKKSRKKAWLDEGCLSIRPWYGKTHRSVKATVEAYDENGKKFTYGGADLLAQIFQHEVDHLDGILFSDHAKEMREYFPEKKL